MSESTPYNGGFAPSVDENDRYLCRSEYEEGDHLYTQCRAAGNSPADDLIHHLRDSLGSGYKLYHPAMPARKVPIMLSWKIALQSSLPVGGNKVALVGHSLGASVIVKYLSEGLLQVPVAGLFLVSTPIGVHVDGHSGNSCFNTISKPACPRSSTPSFTTVCESWVPYSHSAFYVASSCDAYSSWQSA